MLDAGRWTKICSKSECFQDLNVEVRTFSGRCHRITMQSATLDNFKEVVEEKFDIEAACQRLIVEVEELCQSNWHIIATASEIVVISRTSAQVEWRRYLDNGFCDVSEFANAPDEIREDIDIATTFAANHGLELIPMVLRDDRNFILRVLAQHMMYMSANTLSDYLPKQFYGDREIMLRAVQKSGVLASRLHELAPKDMLRDRQVIVAACESLRTQSQLDSVPFLLAMVEENQYDADLVLMALKTSPRGVERVFEVLPRNLQYQRKVMWATIKTGIDTDGKLSILQAFVNRHCFDLAILRVPLRATPVEWIPSLLTTLPAASRLDIQLATALWRQRTQSWRHTRPGIFVVNRLCSEGIAGDASIH